MDYLNELVEARQTAHWQQQFSNRDGLRDLRVMIRPGFCSTLQGRLAVDVRTVRENGSPGFRGVCRSPGAGQLSCCCQSGTGLNE
jgi:hypothetical protein